MSALPAPRRKGDLAIAQPYSLQAEHAVIGALISDPLATRDQVAHILSADDFYDPFARLAYGRAIAIMAAARTPDVVSLTAALDGIVALPPAEIEQRLSDIYVSYPTAGDALTWAHVVVEKSRQRQIHSTGARLQEIAHAQDMSLDDKLSEAHRLLAGIAAAMTADSLVPTDMMLMETLELIEENSTKGGALAGLSTGMPELDEATAGLHPGDMIILGARPAMGKTSLALTVAANVAANPDRAARRGVLFVSLEMGTTQIGMRWLALRQAVPVQHMRTGRVEPHEWLQLQRSLDDAAGIPFSLELTPSITVEQIAAKARRLKSESGLGLILIDYLQLITDSGRQGANKAERLGEISRALKQLARELELPIIALSQLSRDVEKRQDKRPMVSDLRESGALEQDADSVIFIYRDEVYNKGTTPEPGIAELIIAKQRNGPTTTVKVPFDGATTLFGRRQNGA